MPILFSQYVNFSLASINPSTYIIISKRRKNENIELCIDIFVHTVRILNRQIIQFTKRIYIVLSSKKENRLLKFENL
jgi:hypothetical protein